jgi:hypothetical protein
MKPQSKQKKINPKIHMETQNLQIAKIILIKKNKVRGISTPSKNCITEP